MATTFTNLCVSSLFMATTLLGTTAFADAPARPRLTVTGLSCLNNPGAADIDDTNTKIHLEFNDFVANSERLANSRAVCSLFIAVENVKGWQFRVKSVRYNHDTTLERGGERTTETSYHFQGQAETVRHATTMSGPVEATGYTTVHNMPKSESVYSRCGAGRALVFSPSTRVNKVDGGSVEIHAAELELEWKKCL